jgi:ferredoxin, 2Fe-2S
MVRITFVNSDGNQRETDAVIGETLAMTAMSNLVAGVIGECGGGLSCATCHIFIDDQWADVVGGPNEDELDMLETTAVPATERSRLSCQVMVGEELSGLIVHVPERQD